MVFCWMGSDGEADEDGRSPGSGDENEDPDCQTPGKGLK